MRVRKTRPSSLGADMFARGKTPPLEPEEELELEDPDMLAEDAQLDADSPQVAADEVAMDVDGLGADMEQEDTPVADVVELVPPAATAPDVSAPTPAPVAAPAPVLPVPQPPASGIDLTALQQAAQTARTTATEVQKVQNAVAAQEGGDEPPQLVASTLTTLRDLANALRQMGFRFSLSNTRSEVLQTLTNLNLAKVAREVARIPTEQMASLISQFVPAAKLIPPLLAIGYKPVHNTGIDESYPTTAQYELTLTNGLTNITVLGVYDWDAGQELTTIRYASNAELLRYGLLREGTVSVASARSLFPSGYMPEASPILSLNNVQRLLENSYVSDTGTFVADVECYVSVSSGLVPGRIRGFVNDVAAASAVALVDFADGYYLADVRDLHVTAN